MTVRSAMLALAISASLPMAAAAQVVLGQVDTFQDGTTGGWGAGASHPTPPTNIPSGGPAGAGDAFLQLRAIGGSGPGRALAAFNRTQWAGDYTAAGITRISLDVNNAGPGDASLRLLIWDRPPAGNPTNSAITSAVLIPAGSGWQQISFLIDAPSLTPLLGTASGALTSATELRLFHNPDPTYPDPPIGPPPVTLTLGVDNIRAIPAPPAAATLALAAAGRRRRRTPATRQH